MTPRTPGRLAPRRILSILLYAGYLLALVEGTAFLLAKLPMTRARLFSDGALFVKGIAGAQDTYRRFLSEVYDPELGWDNPRGRTSVNRACGQRTVTATYLDDRSRLTPGMTGEPALLAFGDSFTRGDGVDDDETYPAQLSRLLGRRVVNHGVGGYGPVQAVLKFRRRAADYPGARTVLLGITHDDIYRMLNSYRPAYFPNSAGMFAFQPYMRGPVQHPNPNGPVPASFDDVLTLARRAFRDDYWALAEPRFPYTLALFDSLSRPPVWLRLLRRVDLSWVLRRAEFRTALEALLGGFADSARSAGMTPIVLFMPQDAGERAVFDRITRHLGQTLRGRALVVAVRDDGYQWNRYLPHAHCHPSVDGYTIIAEHAVRAVRQAEALFRVESTSGRDTRLVGGAPSPAAIGTLWRTQRGG